MSVYNLGKPRRAVRPSPVFLAFVAVAAVGGVLAWTQNGQQSRLGDFGVFLLVIGGWVVSLCLHEFSHAFIAYKAGDRDVESAGYLTLNPFKYAHPVLSIVLPLLFIVQGGIGLPGGAVYLHPHAFRSRAMQSLAAAAGPAVNAAFAVILLFVAKGHLSDLAQLINSVFNGQQAPSTQHGRFWAGLAFLGLLQITATVLNLLPIPGLDGWSIIEPYLDPATQKGSEMIKPWGMIGVIVLLQFDGVRTFFFRIVYTAYDWTGADRNLAGFGQEFFKFWVKNPQ